jgi:hypothetical protein
MKVLWSAIRRHYKETLKWLAFTLFGGLIPLWGGMLLFRLFSIKFGFATFSSNGEFALYSAGLVAPAFYLIVKDYKDSIFIFRSVFTLISLGCLLVSMMLFAGVTAANNIGNAQVPIKLDVGFLRTSTLLLFAVSVIISFIATAVDNYRILPEDIRDERKEELGKLEDAFDKLEEKDESN